MTTEIATLVMQNDAWLFNNKLPLGIYKVLGAQLAFNDVINNENTANTANTTPKNNNQEDNGPQQQSKEKQAQHSNTRMELSHSLC